LWTAEALRAATGGRLDAPGAVTGVAIDSRSVVPGDLFVALVAERDGHDFVADAFARGAAAAMVARDLGDPRCLVVEDTLAGLTALGAAGRARSAARVVAVTGSVGKTTTKEMLRLILGAAGRTHAAVDSYNNHWGVPLTLARMPADTEYAVIEIGMNQPGEIAPLSRLAQPHVALITAIGACHIGHLGSLEAIAVEKASIAAGLSADGVLVVPHDAPFRALLRGPREIAFGVALSVAADPEGTDVTAEIAGEHVAFRVGTPGAHMVANAIAALTAAVALGAPLAGAASLRDFRALPGRGALSRIATPDGGTATLLDEAFNGQPPSMRAALALLGTIPATRRIAVLGQMGELGDFAAAEHRALAGPVLEAADRVFACGPLMRHLVEALPARVVAAHTETSAALAPLVAAALRDGDAVLVKGSKATKMGAVLAALMPRDA